MADAELRPLDEPAPGSGRDTMAADEDRVSTRADSRSSTSEAGRTDLASTVTSLESALVLAAVETLGGVDFEGRVA
jgi:hypothetical protein